MPNFEGNGRTNPLLYKGFGDPYVRAKLSFADRIF